MTTVMHRLLTLPFRRFKNGRWLNHWSAVTKKGR